MDVHEMRVFVRVASLRNITAAAVELDMSPSNVSKRLQGLEDSLGVRLFDRNTRRIRITEEGQILLKHVERVLSDVDAAKAAVRRNKVQPAGTLRVTAPASLGCQHIRPGICEFIELYPEIKVNLSLTDRLVDIIDEGYDVAIRTGALPDSQLIAKRLAPDKYYVLAAPAYLARHGPPGTPQDLTQHNCLVLGDSSLWTLLRGEEQFSVRVSGTLACNNAEMLREAAVNGIGIIRTSLLKAQDNIDNRQLVRVLPEYSVAGDAAIWALFASSRHMPPKVRVFLDFFAQRFESVWGRELPVLKADEICAAE